MHSPLSMLKHAQPEKGACTHAAIRSLSSHVFEMVFGSASTAQSAAKMEGAILCLGNPLLDVSSNVDAGFLAKYDVRAGQP